VSQSLIGTSDATKYARSAPLGSLAAVRIEMGFRNLVDAGGAVNQYLFRLEPCAGVFVLSSDPATFLIADYVDGLFDGLAWHETGYASGPRAANECLLRFQFDPAIPRVSLEVWDLYGNRHAQKVITGVSAAAWNVTNWMSVLNRGGAEPYAGEVDFCRIYNTTVALGAAAPTRAVSGTPLHAWEFEGNLTDTGSSPVNMAWQGGGAPTYGTEPLAPTTAPVLSSATYATGGGLPDRVGLVFTDPNSGSVQESHVDVERRLSPSGDWRAIGWALAGETTYTDALIAHATAYDYRLRARNRFGVTAYSNVVTVTTGAGTDTNPVITENLKPGTAAWGLTNAATAREIEGYCDATSYNRGATVNLKVNSLAAENFNLEVFRLGWYGGLGARRIRNVLAVAGTAQTIAAETNPGGGSHFVREMAWTTSYALALTDADPTEWPSGIYLARLTQVTAGKQAYIVFCVRDDTRRSRYLLNQPVNTYQAYNAWPNTQAVYNGRGLYPFNSTGSAPTNEVSFNRPYGICARADGAYGIGAGNLLAQNETPNLSYASQEMRTAGAELNFIRWIEKEGYDVQYCTDVDLHAAGETLWRRCFSLLFPGHQEYWSREMRDTVRAARDYGRHLAFFAANAAYWKVLIQPASVAGTPNRAIFATKDLGGSSGTDFNGTVRWRDMTGPGDPEWNLMGVQYEGFPKGEGTMTIAAPATHPVFAGTGLVAGSTIPGVIGMEWDNDDAGTVPGTVVLAHSVFASGPPVTVANPTADMTIYPAALNPTPAGNHAGARVFAAGTLQIPWALDDYGVGLGRPTSFLHTGMQQLVRNIMADQGEAVITEAGAGGPGVATHLEILTQPSGFASGSSCTVPGVVKVAAADGSVVPDWQGRIVATVSGAGTAVITGPSVVQLATFGGTPTHDGIATFRRVALRGVGQTNTITYTAYPEPGFPPLAPVTSAPITVTAAIDQFAVFADGTQATAALPRVTPVCPAFVADVTVTVAPAALQAKLDLDGALDAANGGTLNRDYLVPNLTNYVAAAGPFIMPLRPANATGYQRVRCEGAMPVEYPYPADMGTRAVLRSSAQSLFIPAVSAGGLVAKRFILAGLTLGPTPGANIFAIAMTGTGGPDQDTLAKVPEDIWFDRCLFDGTSTGEVDHAVLLWSKGGGLSKCRMVEIHSNTNDDGGHGVTTGNGPGPYLIDAKIESAGIPILFSAEVTIPGIIPSDITLLQAHLFRPFAWMGVWKVKTNLDMKNAQRVLFESPIIENCWPDAWTGPLTNIKSVNQYDAAPQCGTTDVTFRGPFLRNGNMGFFFGGSPEAKEAANCSRIALVNPVVVNVPAPFMADGGDTADIEIDHPTALPGLASAPTFAMILGSAANVQRRHRFTNAMVPNYGGYAQETLFPPDVFDPAHTPGLRFDKGVFGPPQAGYSMTNANYAASGGTNYVDLDPLGNPVTLAGVQFVDLSILATWDVAPPAAVCAALALLVTSPYHHLGTDGTDIGADMAAVIAGLGGYSPPPPVLVATSLGMVRQAIGGPAGTAFPTQPQVEVLDQFGARLTSSTAVITANLYTGTGALIGTVAVPAIAGLDTWATLGADTEGVKVVRYTSPGLTPVDGAPVTVTAAGAPLFTWVAGPTRLSKPRHSLKQGDTEPPRRVQLLGADGTPQQLPSGTIVRYTLRGPDGNVIRRRAVATIESPTTGTVVYQYAAADVQEFGLCTDEFEVTGPDSNVLTFPNGTEGTVKIRPQLA
jgi:hypothetical protein